MPCETATVSGPEPSTGIDFTQFDVSTGENEITAQYTIRNNGNVLTSVDVVTTLNGQNIRTDRYTLSSGETASDQITATTNFGQGESENMEMCSDIENVNAEV